MFFILGSLHGVQLFPRESCSCSINQRCAHIMAVMIALGMPVTYDKKGAIKVLKPLMVTTPADDFVLDLQQDSPNDDQVFKLFLFCLFCFVLVFQVFVLCLTELLLIICILYIGFFEDRSYNL